MSEAQNTTAKSAWTAVRGDMRATIKLLRHQIQLYAEVPQLAEGRALAERRSARRQVPKNLPESLERLLHVYQQRHPEFELEPICYLTFGSTDDNRNALELDDMPDDEQLVVLSCTESAADVKEVYVETQTLLLRRRRKE